MVRYGPGVPYFISLLFRIFGIHINVAYLAGSLAASSDRVDTVPLCAVLFVVTGGVRDWICSVDPIFRSRNL